MRTDKGAVVAELTEIELSDPTDPRPLRPEVWPLAARTRARSWSTRSWPTKGYGIGETLDRPGAGHVDPIVVGVAESTTIRDFPIAAGADRSLRTGRGHLAQWLVDGPPVSWRRCAS